MRDIIYMTTEDCEEVVLKKISTFEIRILIHHEAHLTEMQKVNRKHEAERLRWPINSLILYFVPYTTFIRK